MAESNDRLPAFSVRQPMADLILTGVKDVENRSVRTRLRGTVLIHASATFSETDRGKATDFCRKLRLLTSKQEYEPQGVGCILGMADIVDSVTSTDSPWFEGPHGWILARPRFFKFPAQYKGAVGIFYVPRHVVAGTIASRAKGAVALG